MTPDLWTEKYRPLSIDGIAGQQKTVQEVLSWLETWKPGKALFLYGAPGIGKNLIIETIAREKNLMVLQLDASDERGQKDIESLLGAGSKSAALFHKGKIILIDEVDGISGTERGAIATIAGIIKESLFPVIVIANDPWKEKLKPLKQCCKLVGVPRVRAPSVEKRLREICDAEKIKYDEGSIKSLARWSQGDMRSAINDLQMTCKGRSCVLEKDMESLGFRERENELFNVLPTIFHSGKIGTTSRSIWDSDKDPDDVFWWIEQNLSAEIRSHEGLAKALDILSKADIFRARVMKQQNWRFKAYMVDMMSSVSLFRGAGHHEYVAYKPPKKFIDMAKVRFTKAGTKALVKKIGTAVHGSSRAVKRDYMPYLRIMMKKPQAAAKRADFTVELSEDDIKLLKGNQ